jgi:hypothetical protein
LRPPFTAAGCDRSDAAFSSGAGYFRLGSQILHQPETAAALRDFRQLNGFSLAVGDSVFQFVAEIDRSHRAFGRTDRQSARTQLMRTEDAFLHDLTAFESTFISSFACIKPP